MPNNLSLQRMLNVQHLYQQIQRLEQENTQLKAQLEQAQQSTINPKPNNTVAAVDNFEVFQTLMGNMAIPISVSRVADGKILYANALFVSTLGLSSWAVPNYTITEFYTNPAQYQTFIAQLNQSEAVYRQALSIKHKDGYLLQTTVSVLPFNFNQQPALLTIFHDIGDTPSDSPGKYSAEPSDLQQQTQSLRCQSQAMRDLCHYNTLHSKDLKGVIRHITETAAQTLNVERVSVWLHPILQHSLLDPDGFTKWLETAPLSASPWSNILNLKFVCLDLYEYSNHRHWIDGQLPIQSSCPFEVALLTQHLIEVNLTTGKDLRWDETADAGQPTAQTSSQSLQIPIRLGNEIIGMLWIETHEPERNWSVEEQTFVEFLAHFVALSLEQFERQLTEKALFEVKQQLEEQVEKRTAELKQAVIQLREEMVERIKTESALEKALDATQAASQVKSTFIATMSHEFRTPLHIILGYADMLHEEATEQNLTDFVPDVEHIRQAGQKLLHLIDNILDLAKIEARQMVVQRESIDLELLTEELLSLVSPQAEQNQNQLIVDRQAAAEFIYADVNKLRQILLNLLDNALKFTDRGQVKLTLSEQQRHGKNWICFQVRDTGIGIAPEQQQHLFQSFTQVDPSLSRSYGGMGLGLTLSYHFCRLMGGEITVSSQLGSGSTFAVYLPREGDSC
ncbi:MAG: ATP-binding protein [Microcoleaceae cyanobacterium]